MECPRCDYEGSFTCDPDTGHRFCPACNFGNDQIAWEPTHKITWYPTHKITWYPGLNIGGAIGGRVSMFHQTSWEVMQIDDRVYAIEDLEECDPEWLIKDGIWYWMYEGKDGQITPSGHEGSLVIEEIDEHITKLLEKSDMPESMFEDE